MKYIRVSWPESQVLMNLTEADEEDYSIEFGSDCSYLIPEEYYDEVMELAELRQAEESMVGRGADRPRDCR